MKKNIIKMRAYGFTLVELLATIVVIAVVSLITVPAVTAIIERTRKASFAKSAMNVNKISDNYYISNSAIFSKFNDITFDCNNVLCSSQSSPNIKNLNLGAEGAMGNGYVKIYKGGSVEFLLTNGKYCAEKNPNKEEVKIYNGNCEGIIIDNEKIRISSIKTTSTTSTIKVFGDVITGKSGVSKYEFYIDNKLDATVKTNDTNYTHTFEKVSGKNHKIKVRVYNGTYGSENFDESIGMDEKEIDASLLDFGTITIVPSSTAWKTSKTYTISGTTEGNIDEELQYQVKYNGEIYNEQNDKDKWQTISSPTTISIDTMSTKDNPTTIYVRLNDGVNTSDAKIYKETKIDTTAPILTIGNITTTTKSIIIPITANKDGESEIKSTECVYGTSASYGTTGVISGNSCVINNVKENTNYYYKVTTMNNAGLSTTKTGNSTTGQTSVSFTTSQNPTNTSYAQSKTVKVSYVATNVTSPTYYVKTTVATTSNINGYNCGTSTDPSTCGTTVTKSYAANTWYKVTGTPLVTFKSNGIIYARINDGKIYSSSSTLSLTKIDTTGPVNVSLTKGTVTTNSITVVANATDNESGISGYEFSIDNGTTWKAKQTSNTYTFSGLKSGTYNIKVRVTNNANLNTTSNTLSVATVTLAKPSISIPSGWATSKSVTIEYPSVATIKQYSLDGGSTWKNYTGAITFTTNGSIVAKASDGINEVTNAGNITQIDTTNPTVSYSLASGTYNENKTITITANDDNFQFMYITVYKDGTVYKEYNRLTNKTQTIDLDSDGTWIVYTNVVDKAGNKLNQEPKTSTGVYYQTYMIDTVNPTVSYSLAGGTYNENKTVRVTVSDTNFKSMSVYVFKNKALVYTNKITSKSIDNTTKNTFDVLLDGDGDWTIYAKATDKAGNKQNQDPNNGDWYYQTYVIKSKETCLTSGDYKTGDAVTCGGYKWHVIRQYIESDDDLHPDPYNPVDPSTQTKYLTILMDAHQLPDMAHCTNDGTNCEINEHNKIKYSWENSLIRKYLNNTLLNELESKISNEIITNKICGATYEYNPTSTTTPSGPSLNYFWGGRFVGYLESEIDRINDQWLDIHKYLENSHEQCKTYTYDKIRLITRSEHYLMHSTYEGVEYDYIAKIPNIKQMLPNYYKSWFIDVPPTYDKYNPFVPIVGSWWGMAGAQDNRYPYYGKSDVSLLFASSSLYSGAAMTDSSTVAGVRPVITIALD